MKIVIAPDSFKDSLSAAGVAQAIARWVGPGLAGCARASMPDG